MTTWFAVADCARELDRRIFSLSLRRHSTPFPGRAVPESETAAQKRIDLASSGGAGVLGLGVGALFGAWLRPGHRPAGDRRGAARLEHAGAPPGRACSRHGAAGVVGRALLALLGSADRIGGSTAATPLTRTTHRHTRGQAGARDVARRKSRMVRTMTPLGAAHYGRRGVAKDHARCVCWHLQGNARSDGLTAAPESR